MLWRFRNTHKTFFFPTDKSRFGHKHLEQLGWKPGNGLGVTQAGNTVHVKVSFKKDNTGLGHKTRSSSKKNSEGDDIAEFAQGLETFQRILADLNGKDSNKVDAALGSRRVNLVMEMGKFGMHFVYGGLLEGTVEKMVDEIKTGKKRSHDEEVASESSDSEEEPVKKKSKKSKSDDKKKEKKSKKEKKEKKDKKEKKEKKEKKDKKEKKEKKESRKIKRSQANPSPTIPAPVVAQRQAVHRHLELNLYLEACKGMFTSCYSIFHLFFSLTNFFGRLVLDGLHKEGRYHGCQITRRDPHGHQLIYSSVDFIVSAIQKFFIFYRCVCVFYSFCIVVSIYFVFLTFIFDVSMKCGVKFVFVTKRGRHQKSQKRKEQ